MPIAPRGSSATTPSSRAPACVPAYQPVSTGTPDDWLTAERRGHRSRPITLGERLGGDGHGFVYAIVGRPHLALKLIHRERSGFRSVARQVAGYRLIEPFPAEILTVKIIASHCGNNEEACYLVVENLHDGRWADRGVVVAPSVLGERERAAARRLCDNLVV